MKWKGKECMESKAAQGKPTTRIYNTKVSMGYKINSNYSNVKYNKFCFNNFVHSNTKLAPNVFLS